VKIQKWMCVLLMCLSACTKQTAVQTNASEVKWENLPEACQVLVKQLEHCAVSRVSQREDAQKMSAVLLEQMGSKTVTEQSKTCQDVTMFWQKACGVAK
jgi:hypothetical protein